MSNGLTDPSMMDRVAQQNLMMQAGLMGQQSLQMVPNSSAQMQPQSPMNLNMMNNMGMNMNLNGKKKKKNL